MILRPPSTTSTSLNSIDWSVAAGLAEANDLRAALLAAVSHDLRTPLSSIKAAATSLLQRDVDWTPQATSELLATIDEEADRLNALVGNLLDMSRLQSGALQLVMRDVGLEEVVPAAIKGLGERAQTVRVSVDETMPRVHADAALLVGPEGGWDDAECAAAQARNVRLVCLGPRTLRADAVPVAAVSILQFLWEGV